MLVILVASILLAIYIAFAFRGVPNAFRYGVCTVAALIHDVLVMLSVAVVRLYADMPQICSLRIRKFQTAWSLGNVWSTWRAAACTMSDVAFENCGGANDWRFKPQHLSILGPYLHADQDITCHQRGVVGP
jgi:hypothetical protein